MKMFRLTSSVEIVTFFLSENDESVTYFITMEWETVVLLSRNVQISTLISGQVPELCSVIRRTYLVCIKILHLSSPKCIKYGNFNLEFPINHELSVSTYFSYFLTQEQKQDFPVKHNSRAKGHVVEH